MPVVYRGVDVRHPLKHGRAAYLRCPALTTRSSSSCSTVTSETFLAATGERKRPDERLLIAGSSAPHLDQRRWRGMTEPILPICACARSAGSLGDVVPVWSLAAFPERIDMTAEPRSDSHLRTQSVVSEDHGRRIQQQPTDPGTRFGPDAAAMANDGGAPPGSYATPGSPEGSVSRFRWWLPQLVAVGPALWMVALATTRRAEADVFLATGPTVCSAPDVGATVRMTLRRVLNSTGSVG